MNAQPERIDLLRQALIFHAGAKARFDRVRAAQKAILDEVATDKWVNGQIPPGTREAEFRFEYEYHYLLVAVAQLDKAIRKLGFAGLDEDLAGPVKELREWYTHFEDPEGVAFHRFIARKEGADPSKLALSAGDSDGGGRFFKLSALAVALKKIGYHWSDFCKRLSPGAAG